MEKEDIRILGIVLVITLVSIFSCFGYIYGLNHHWFKWGSLLGIILWFPATIGLFSGAFGLVFLVPSILFMFFELFINRLKSSSLKETK